MIIYQKRVAENEEKPVFEQLTLNNFKMCSFIALKTFNNYSVIMTNISHSSDCGAVFFFANFWVNSAGCSGKFHVAVEHFENISKISYWTFLKRNWPCLPLWTLINSKSYIAFLAAVLLDNWKVTKIKLARVLVKGFDKSHHLCALHIFCHYLYHNLDSVMLKYKVSVTWKV